LASVARTAPSRDRRRVSAKPAARTLGRWSR
jgi:hypothetical protein